MLSPALLSLLLLLAACVQPSTQLPPTEKQAVEAERLEQDSKLYDQDFSSLYKKPPYRYEMVERIAEIATRVGPAAIELCSQLRVLQKAPERGCVFDVELGTQKDGFNAYADGNVVVLGPKLLELIPDDTHLAFVMAHEFAHNIMNHLEASQKNSTAGSIIGSLLEAMVDPRGNYRTGNAVGGYLGDLSFSPGFEQEADYVGLYILARAGFEIENSPDVWRRMAAVNPQGIYTRTTHPTSAERFVAMRKAIAEIKSKQGAGARLLPELLQPATRVSK